MCVGNPTVNSYCRMWDTGFWAPIYKNWGWQNRTTTVRVASGGRFEYRGVDSSCNPYLTVAALLRPASTASQQDRPGPAAAGQHLRPAAEGEEIEKVPDCLGAALEALAADEVIKSAMPGRLYKVFDHYKRDEWERYLAAVTDWERDEYLEVPARSHVRDRRDHLPGRRRTTSVGDDPHAPVDEASRARLDRLRAVRAAADDWVMRVKLADANTPRDFEFPTGCARNRAEIERRLRPLGATDRRVEDATEYAFKRTSPTTATSRRWPTASRTSAARRCSRSATRCRSSRTSATPRRWPASTGSTASSARTRSATSAWRPSPTSTSRARTRTGRIRSPTSPSSTTGS